MFVLDAATPTNTYPPHEGRQPETTGNKTTLETKKPTTATNTKAARSKVALKTPTINCLEHNNKSKLFTKPNNSTININYRLTTTIQPTTININYLLDKDPKHFLI